MAHSGGKCGSCWTLDESVSSVNTFFLSHRYTICHKTEVVKNTLDPVWQAFKIPVRALCNGDYDRYGVVLSHFLYRNYTLTLMIE